MFSRGSKRSIDDSCPTEAIAKDELLETKKESLQQEMREAQNIIANAEQEKLEQVMREVDNLDDMSGEQLFPSLGDALKKAEVDPDAGPDADVQICGAPADSSPGAPDADEDDEPPWRRSKKRRSDAKKSDDASGLVSKASAPRPTKGDDAKKSDDAPGLLIKASAPRPTKGDDAEKSDDASGPPRPADPMAPPPAPHRIRPPRKTTKKKNGTPCAGVGCKLYCKADECIWCAAHCPGTPESGDACKVHWLFPGRCTEESEWCRNKFSQTTPFCIYLKCGDHCKKSDCPRHNADDKPERAPSQNKQRGQRTERAEITGIW